MNRTSVIKSFIFCFFSISVIGCNKMSQVVTPTCSDETTLTLVRQILSENIAETGRELSPEELKKRLTFNLPHSTKLEENIRKYTCEASLIARNGSAEHKMSLVYESQLDDDLNHLVQITNLTNGDVDAMRSILTAEKANTTESQSADAATVLNPTDADNPKFKDYPAPPAYSGPPANHEPSEDSYITDEDIISALSEKPNFASEYVASGSACGMDACFTEFFVNKKTGELAERIFNSYSAFDENGVPTYRYGQIPEETRVDSNLLVVLRTPEPNEIKKVSNFFADYYVLTDGQLKLIKSIPVPKPSEYK